MVIMQEPIFIDVEVSVADLHDEIVHCGCDVHEAVQLVEDGNGVGLFAGGLGEVHGRWQLVRVVVGYINESGADCVFVRVCD